MIKTTGLRLYCWQWQRCTTLLNGECELHVYAECMLMLNRNIEIGEKLHLSSLVSANVGSLWISLMTRAASYSLFKGNLKVEMQLPRTFSLSLSPTYECFTLVLHPSSSVNHGRMRHRLSFTS